MELRFNARILQNGDMDAELIERIAKWCMETGSHA